MPNRRFHEIKYTVPLATPLQSEATIAQSDAAEWQLICVPGTPCRRSLFTRLIKAAPNTLDVTVIARPGFGKDHKQPVLDFRDQIKAIEPFLGKKRTIVLGISYGGALALNAAMEYSDQIEGVMTGAALVSEPFDYARAFADLGRFEWANRIAPQHLRHSSQEIAGRRPQIGPLLDRLSDLTMPAEILHGNLDNLVSRKDAHRLVNAIGKNAAYEEIVGGTHYLEYQMPGRVLAAVDRLIGRIEAGG
jgi:pimeloyl-ACP methyl ester carboxylesterase